VDAAVLPTIGIFRTQIIFQHPVITVDVKYPGDQIAFSVDLMRPDAVDLRHRTRRSC